MSQIKFHIRPLVSSLIIIWQVKWWHISQFWISLGGNLPLLCYISTKRVKGPFPRVSAWERKTSLHFFPWAVVYIFRNCNSFRVVLCDDLALDATTKWLRLDHIFMSPIAVSPSESSCLCVPPECWPSSRRTRRFFRPSRWPRPPPHDHERASEQASESVSVAVVGGGRGKRDHAAW